MQYYLIILLSILITGCSQQDDTQPKGSGSNTQPTTVTTPNNGTRLALVIGNGDYDENTNKLKLGELDNPVNDAYDMASALKGLGYQVILRTDVNKTDFNRAVRDFRQGLSQSGGVGLFYFSGHGFQYENINYLMPLKADIRQGIDIKDEALKADAVLQQMQLAHSGVNIIILDACRDSIPDDFFKVRENKGAFKGLETGLTQMNPQRGSLIAYSTAPNTTAWGGLPGERNSVYTKYLLKALKTKAHLNYAELFIEVRKQVSAETKDEEVQQVPWEANSLTRKFCFGTCQDEDWDRERAAELKQQEEKLARERAELERQRLEQERLAQQRAAELERQRLEQEKLARERAELERQRAELERQRIEQESSSLEITRLLQVCKVHFDANRLTTGAGGTALACYKEVLKKDPSNAKALSGLKNIEARYVSWINKALDRGNESKAKQYLASLGKVNPESPKLAELEERISALALAELERQRLEQERLAQQRVEQEKRSRQRANKSYRYTDNGDGTVTDNRSGLIWMKNANCFGRQNWKTAMQSAANLAHGQCGLRDGSRRGMWRLPTKEEWKAMTDDRYSYPALSNAAGTGQWKEGDAFLGVPKYSWYWSSTTKNLSSAWYGHLYYGNVYYNDKTSVSYVWAVRGGH
jgi:uncharacterized caspase-like protein